MKYAINFFLFILLANVSAFAGQLIVKESVWRGGSAYVLNVNSPEHCIRVITNLSNIHKYTNKDYIPYVDKYFKKEFTCVRSNGTISKHAFIYQIPYSFEGYMCLRWSDFSGLYKIDKCVDNKEFGFTTRPIITHHVSIQGYVKENQEE